MSVCERYEILHPLESGPEVSVYAYRDRSNGCADRVLTLLPNRCDRGAFEDCVLARRELRSTLLIGVRDVAFRGKRPGVITDRIPPEYEQGATGRIQDRRRFALDLVRLLGWLSLNRFFLGILTPRQLYFRADGKWIANFLGPYRLFKTDFRSRDFASRAAPEYFESKQENREADLYSLGLFLYQLFVGQPAFSSESAQDLARKQQIARPLEPRRGSPELGKDIEELILGLLEKDPAARAGFSYSQTLLDPTSRQAPGVSAPWRRRMLGRDAELGQLRKLLSDHRRKPGFRFVCLSGPGGVGKTSLAAHFEWIARIRGFQTIPVSYSEEGRPMPLISWLAGRGKVSSSLEAGEVLKNDHDLARLFEGLVVVRAEDVQWIDEADVAAYQRLHSLGIPVLVVATVRTNAAQGEWRRLENWPCLNNQLVRLDLGPLSSRAASELAEALRPDCPNLDRDWAVAASGGNPRFLIETMRKTAKRMGRPGSPCGGSGMGGLTDTPRMVLRALAVAGQLVAVPLLADATGLRQPQLTKATRELEDLGLVCLSSTSTGVSSVDLSHREHLDSMATEIAEDEHRRLSLNLARAYLAEYRRVNSKDLLDRISRHFLRSGEPSRALPYLPAAVQFLLEAGLFRRAANLLLEGARKGVVDAGDWANARQLFHLLYQCGEHETLASMALQFAGTVSAEAAHRKGRLFLYAARAKNLVGDWNGAAGICKAALRELTEIDPDVNARIKTISMIAHTQLGCYTEAKALKGELERDLLTRNRSGQFIHSALAIFKLEWEGNPASARDHAVRSALPFEPGAPMPGLGRICSVATCLNAIGDLHKSNRILAAVMDQARAIANPELMSLAYLNRNTILRRWGRARELEQSLQMMQRGTFLSNRNYLAENSLQAAKFKTSTLDLADVDRVLDKAVGETAWTTARTETCRAWVSILRGDAARARELLSGPDPRNRLIRAQRQLVRAQASLQLGSLQQARAEAEGALKTLSRDMVYLRAKASLQLGLVELAQGSVEEALDDIERSLVLSRERFYFPLMARGYARKGQCLALMGHPRQGRVFAARAMQVMSRVDFPGLRAEIQRILGQILNRLDRNEEARLSFVRALRILRAKSLGLPARHRGSFDALWIKPIEKDLASMVKFRRAQPSYLQAVERFAARTGTLRNMEELGRELIRAIHSTVPNASAAVLRLHSNGSTSIIAQGRAPGEISHRPGSRPAGGVDRFSLEEAFRVVGVGPLVLRVSSPQGGFAESDYDLIKCLVRIVEGLQPDWNDSPVGSRRVSPKDRLELSGGRLILGRHPSMRRLLDLVRQVGPSGATVLISGESGTGKELVARALHESNSRADRPWVAVNCAALPSELVESELFGYRKGSFTGAETDKPGLVEAAHGGTLFLDEIASMPLEHQARLLRMLQEGSVRRLGESSERQVDVRIIAATNQPLERLVQCGEFREDLYHRLNVIQLEIPPLRARLTDIPLLARHFLAELSRKHGRPRETTDGFFEALLRLPFRGNVRELRNVVEQACLLGKGDQLRASDIREPGHHSLAAGDEAATSRSQQLFHDLIEGRLDFWTDVRRRFLARDLSRPEVRRIISLGLASTDGSYRQLVRKFNLREQDYRRFLAFLSHHGCKVDFRLYRTRR